MAVGGTYRIKLHQTYFAALCTNVFWYGQVVGNQGAARATNGFIANVLPAILAIQSTAVTTVRVEAENINDSTDFDVAIDTSPGVRVGDGMPNFVSWGFILFSTDKKVRAGGKRFAGVSEADVDTGLANAAALIVLNALSAVLDSNYQDTQLANEFAPILYTPGNIATSQTPLAVNVADVSYGRVSTQSSRKVF